MQEEMGADEYDPVTLLDSGGYIESIPFDKIESDSVGLYDFGMDTELSAIRPSDDRMREMNRQLKEQINYLSKRLNNTAHQ